MNHIDLLLPNKWERLIRNRKVYFLNHSAENTGPAITLAALKSLEEYENPSLLILSSDHIFNNDKSFLESINKGIKYLEKGHLITFGITPTSPHTGYGYIESEKQLDIKSCRGERLIKFIEKPDLNYARELIKDKRYSWNSGIFLFKASTILKELKKVN